MNGKVARRIRRAAWQVILSTGSRRTLREVIRELKGEYKALPYHKRDYKLYGYRSLSHKEQEQRHMYRFKR